MSEVLSDEWCAAATSALADAASGGGPVGAPDADGEVELVVAGDAGKVTSRWVVSGGRLVGVRLVGDGEEPAPVSIPVTDDDLRAIVAGDLDPAVAYMRGDIKPEGSSAAVLAFVSALNRPECRDALAGLSA